MDMELVGKLSDAERALREKCPHRPRIAVILGSGLGEFAARIEGTEVPFAELPGFPRPTVAGHSGMFKVGRQVAVMAGRVHYYEGHPLGDVVLPVFLLHRMGVRTIVVTNAAGGVNRSYKPGDLVLIRDHVNFMGANPLRGPNPDGFGPRFPDMTSAYTPALRALAQSISDAPLAEGVYAAFAGPSYETPAEIHMLSVIGVDLVGMSTVPEVIAASYLGMRVLGISCVTNMAAGILPQPLDHSEVIARGREAGPRFVKLLTGIIERLGSEPSGSEPSGSESVAG
jgi:purine-nucleoside phosphorylase